MNLAELQREAHAISKDHGWWPPNCPQCGDDNTHWRNGFKGDGTQSPDEGYWACHECLEADNSPFIFESRFGFIPKRTFGDLIADVHSKLSEALEAYREHGLEPFGLYPYIDTPYDEPPPKPEGLSYELADVVIRVADMAEWYGWELQVYPGVRIPNPGGFGDWIAKVHSELSLAYIKVSGSAFNCSLAVEVVFHMAAHYGIDLDAAIATKIVYNKTRPASSTGRARGEMK